MLYLLEKDSAMPFLFLVHFLIASPFGKKFLAFIINVTLRNGMHILCDKNIFK